MVNCLLTSFTSFLDHITIADVVVVVVFFVRYPSLVEGSVAISCLDPICIANLLIDESDTHFRSRRVGSKVL